MSKLIVKTPKPRNPLVAAMRLRRAGRHRDTTGALRHEARRALRRELAALPLPRSKPPGP